MANAKRKKLEPKDDKDLADTRRELAILLKGSIIMHLWDRNEYFHYTNRRNDIVKRALEFLNEGK